MDIKDINNFIFNQPEELKKKKDQLTRKELKELLEILNLLEKIEVWVRECKEKIKNSLKDDSNS